MSRFTNGWIKAWRKAVETDLSDNLALWGIWNWLLYSATYKETKKLWEGQQRTLPPGSVVFGLREMADKWGVSKATISKWLNYLETTKRITFETCTRGSLVTIRNWEIYQSAEAEVWTPTEHGLNTDCTRTEHGLNTDCTRTEHEVTISKEVKKEEEEEIKKEEVSTAVERNRSPLGAIESLSGNPLSQEILSRVTHRLQKAWVNAFGDVEWIRQEIIKAATWLEANPRRRPKSPARFLGNWLSAGWEKHRKTQPTTGSPNSKQVLSPETQKKIEYYQSLRRTS